MTTTRVGRSYAEQTVREWRPRPGSQVDRERYRRDPFAHLEEAEVWRDDGGREWCGHIFIPHLQTLEPMRLQPFQHQVEFAGAWIDLERLKESGELVFANVHVEKSRQMGMTWWLAYLVWWLVSYHDVPGGYLNMDWAEVDNGGAASTPESFFGKVRFIQQRLPARFRAPLIFRGGGSAEIRNVAEPMAYVVGEGATADPGRGGTYAWWIVDEAARLRYGEAAHAALSRACPSGRVYNSTPEGEGNIYFRLKETRPRAYRFVRFHWSEHSIYGAGQHIAGDLPDCPLCDGTRQGLLWDPSDPQAHRYPGKLTSPWYDAAIIDLTDDQVAAELDIDYEGSLSSRVYPEFTDEVHVLDEIPFDPNIDIHLAWDYGLDTTAVAILQDAPYELRQIGELEIGDANPDQVAEMLRHTLAGLGVPEKQLSHTQTGFIFSVGDPSGEGRDLATARPLSQDYARQGFPILSRHQFVSTTILATKRLLLGRPKPYRVSKRTCPATIAHWKGNRWPTDKQGRRKPGQRPEDDQHNHMMRALAYYVSYRWPVPPTEQSIADATAAAVREMLPDRSGMIDPEIHYGMKL